MLTYGSVCSGIEAATAAWHPLGWRAAFFSEIDTFPSALLTHRYPHVPNLGDLNGFKTWPDAAIDLLVGGTPCQSFSVAGLRAGLRDPRGNLALVYLALAARHRPRWLVWENVPGVLSSHDGRDFGAFLGALGKLGYGFAYRVLDAQFFGVAQRRRRVFVVAHLGDWRPAAAVLFEPESLRRDPPPRRPTREEIAGSLVARAGSSSPSEGQPGGLIAAEVAGTLTATSPRGGTRAGATEAHAGMLIAADIVSSFDASYGRLQGASGQDARHGHSTLVAYGGNDTRGPIDVATAVRAKGGTGHNDFESETFLVFDTTQITHPENRCNPQPGDPCHPLAAAGHPPAIAFDCRASDPSRGLGDDLSQTLRGMNSVDSNANDGSHAAVLSHMAVRRLTPRECERLQGYEDDYTLIPVASGKTCPDGPRYKALGNSMAVPVMAWLGRRIEMVDGLRGC